jgi:hypothetical protein
VEKTSALKKSDFTTMRRLTQGGINVTELSSPTANALQIAANAHRRLTAFKTRHGLLKPMAPEELTAHMLKTYWSLRMCLLSIAIFFPFVLIVAGYELGHVGIQHSLSAYYWAGFDDPSEERTIFVGTYFVVGACLIAYRGFSNEENWALNIAGLLAWGVALFPMECTNDIECLRSCAGQGHSLIHGTCGVVFLLLLAYVALFRSKDTLGDDSGSGQVLSEKDRRWYARQYNIAAAAMFALPLAAVIITYFCNQPKYWTISVECTAVWAFAYYWAIKSLEMKKSQVEKRAARQSVFADSVGRIKSTGENPEAPHRGSASAAGLQP